MDIVIIGAGLSGSVIARKMAEKGKKVLLLEKRENIGGNIFDFRKDGVLVHKYGPHIFHTSNEKVNKFMNRFWELNHYKNVVEAQVLGQIIPIPFNFSGIDKFWPDKAEKIKEKLVSRYGKNARISILELLNENDELLQEVAEFIFKNIFENYTIKMWDVEPKAIDKSVLSRVPVVIGYNNLYFSDKYEGLPKGGYTNTVAKILDHPNIEIRKNVNAVDVLEFKEETIWMDDLQVKCPVVYTGPLDELFNYSYGVLNYRSLDIVFETLKINKFQIPGVVNYPAHPKFTRITEYKNMTLETNKDITVISREYPGAFNLKSDKFNEPYYPMINQQARNAYNHYLSLAKNYKNLYLAGRLATYKYLNMDVAVKQALEIFEKIVEDLK